MGKINDYEAIVAKIEETANQNDLLKSADEFSKKIISMFEFDGSIEVDPKTLIDKIVEMFIQKGYSFNASKFVDFTMRAGKKKHMIFYLLIMHLMHSLKNVICLPLLMKKNL